MEDRDIYLKAERAQEWREELRKKIKAKDRTDVPRVKMNEVNAQVRIQSYIEVNSGLTQEQAQKEATRCVDCANPTCITDVLLRLISQSLLKESNKGNFWKLLKF